MVWINKVCYKRARKIASVAIAIWASVVAPPLYGCSTPVFRYAIENWPPDYYEMIVFHLGPLSDNDKAIVNALRERVADERSLANLAIHLVDVDAKMPEPVRQIWQSCPQDDLPWAVVRYPEMSGLQGVAWSGHLTSDTVSLLLDSPKRREIAERLVKNGGIVWLLLESGDRAKDDAAVRSLTAQLERIEAEIGAAYAQQYGQTDEKSDSTYLRGADYQFGEPPPPKLSFSVVRLSRSDRAEQAFVNSLVQMDPDLVKSASEPIAFPIFGRGRLLCAMVGEDIGADSIGSVCEFLTGPCSCQVKALNPGFDLLMAANWDEALANLFTADEPLPMLTGVMPEQLDVARTTQPATVVNTSLTASASTDVAAVHRLARTTLIVLAAVLAAVIVSTLVLWSFVLRRSATIRRTLPKQTPSGGQ